MNKVFIAGAGGIGEAAALILTEHFKGDVKVYVGDISVKAGAKCLDFVQNGSNFSPNISFVEMPIQGLNEELELALKESEVILDCLPGSLAPKIAGWAKEYGSHYANLTEYVAETEQIMELAKDAGTGFVLQTGLAPGFINVLACQLYADFKTAYNNDMLDQMSMKVGALSQHAPSPHYYAFTWSPIGVATEYIKEADVVRNYKKSKIAALSEIDTIIIDGETYEDNFTSGGAADLPEAFSGKIKDLDYKTLRYPGHYEWVKTVVDKSLNQQETINLLEKRMLSEIPMVEDDVVIVYASVKGADENGIIRKLEKSYKVFPSKVGKRTLRAIQSTTAGPLCQMAIMLLEGKHKGVILQSEIPALSFLNGEIVSSIYGEY